MAMVAFSPKGSSLSHFRSWLRAVLADAEAVGATDGPAGGPPGPVGGAVGITGDGVTPGAVPGTGGAELLVGGCCCCWFQAPGCGCCGGTCGVCDSTGNPEAPGVLGYSGW